MEDNNMVSSTETEQNIKAENNEQQEKKEKLYTRSEVEAIKSAERKKIIEDYEAQKTEAEKLAKMNADEKNKYALSKETERANKAEEELNAYKLKDEAKKIANNIGLDISLLDVIDFTKEKATTINDKIETINNVFKKAVENALNDAFKEKTPKTVANNNAIKEKISRASY